jgi:hypothetical protein
MELRVRTNLINWFLATWFQFIAKIPGPQHGKDPAIGLIA